MPSPLKEIGIRKAFQYFYTSILGILYRAMFFPQARVLFLRLCGAKVGKNTIICRGVRFVNLHWNGFKSLKIGSHCWIGDEAMLDLAGGIDMGDYVGLGWRSMIITHLNIAYSDHPLNKHFPRSQKPVIIKDFSLVGPLCAVTPGVTIGEKSFIMVKSLVSRDVPPGVLYGGVPGKTLYKIDGGSHD